MSDKIKLSLTKDQANKLVDLLESTWDDGLMAVESNLKKEIKDKYPLGGK